MNTRIVRFFLVAAVLFALGLGFYASTAHAQPTANVITVHIATDGAPGDHYCSLLEAVANAYFGADLYPGDCAAGGAENIIRFQDVTNLTPSGTVVLKGNTTIDGGVYGATIHAAPNKRVMYINSGSTITLKNLVLAEGNPYNSGSDYEHFGGGISMLNSNLYTDNVIFINNKSCNGGGIYAQDSLVVLTNTTFSNNLVTGGCRTASYGGGAIAFSGGSLYIDRSTFYNNLSLQATYVSGTGWISRANSIYFVENFKPNLHDNLTILNTTINQTAVPYFESTAVSVYLGTGAMTIQNVTIDAGDGLRMSIFASTQNSVIQNTIATANCELHGSTFISNNNLTDNVGCAATAGFTQKTTAELALQPLADNGGLTQTIALGLGSAAIDAGSDSVCAHEFGVNNLDQRGHTRPFGTHCDIGAFEYDGTLTLPQLTPTSVPPTATATPTNTPVPPTATPTTEPACATAPTAPTLNTPTDGAKISTKNVALDWTDANCATRYKLVVRDLTTKTDIVTKNNLTASDLTAKKLVSGHKYRWTVQACNAGGCSAKTEATFKIK